MSEKPDFVCIGAQKAGTAWLYDQVRSHPRGWMPPIKEVKYFHHRWSDTRQQALELIDRTLRRIAAGKPVKARDVEFLRRVAFDSQDVAEGDPAFYRRLFTVAGRKVSGDASPQYYPLPEEKIREMVDGLPATRFVFLVREPVSRIWSQACMDVRQGARDARILSDLDAFGEFFDRPIVRGLSFQSEALERWRAALPEGRFGVFLMDDLIRDASAFRHRVLGFIGLDSALSKIPADYNRKAGHAKEEMPRPIREFLLDRFCDETARLQQLMGGATAAWPSRSGAPSVLRQGG